MSNPGSNLLKQALQLISSNPCSYYRFLGRTTTNAGRFISEFAAGVPVKVGSIQAVPRNKYQIMGLELEKEYVTWFVPEDVIGLERDAAGDQINYKNERYQLVNTTSWFGQDGWLSVLCVKLETEVI